LNNSRVHFSWRDCNRAQFRTGVSLHSHTMHSRETMDFVSRVTGRVPWLGTAIRRQEALYYQKTGWQLNLSNAWWTPPLSPSRAWQLEKSQIEKTLDCNALVSISDHDSVEAGVQLHVLDGMRNCPISVEWTVPYRGTFFHLGIHNLPFMDAAAIMLELSEFTRNPGEEQLGGMLEWLAAKDGVLVVMNHPCWDEKGIGTARHQLLVDAFLSSYRRWIHALELNGLRPWKENQSALALAGRWDRPLISGGDRHGLEPNACVNMTNAGTFSEFVDEVRSDGWSDVLFLPQYREPLRLRILENLFQIIQDDPQHSRGWIHWSDRVFYRNEFGIVRSVAEIWGNHPPAVVRRFVQLMMLFGHTRVRSALKFALAEADEFAL
jgi:hypothetical protein